MSTDNSQLLRIYLSRLVKELVPPELGSDYGETVFHELLNFIESNQKDNWYEIDKLLAEIKNSFASTGHLENWGTFQESVEVLAKFKNSESIARYLVFLQSLRSNENSINDTRPRNPTFNRIASTFGRDSFEGETKSISGSFYGGAADSFENINFDRFSDRRSIYSAAQQHRNISDSRNYTLQEVVIPYFENHVREEDILKYIPFTLVGTTSNLFPLRSGEVELPENISNSESGLIHLVLESGLIYQSLSLIVESFKSAKSVSTIKNSIMSYIFEELTSYMKVVNILSNKQSFSLRSLVCDLSDELVKLRFLHYISRKVEKEPGVSLLSLIHKYQNYGDTIIHECSSSLLKYTLEPFLNCLRSWLVEGELIDRADEFFIIWNPEKGSTEKDLSIDFVAQKVPDFFPKDLGLKVYLIGKTNIFLKKYCKESKWCNGFSQKMNAFLSRLRHNKTFLFTGSDFYKFITDHYTEITNYFTHIIYTKYHFIDILGALKDFLLMGKGDFIQRIITNGAELLSVPSNSLSGHQLTNLLQEAVLSTTVRYQLNLSDEHNVLNNLDARLLEIGHGNIGWDVFTLDYQLQLPISLILNNDMNSHKKDYLKVFNYLWKFKRLEALFTDAWVQQKNYRQSGVLSANGSLFKKINRIRLIQNFLRDFSRTIERFILVEIIDMRYKKLSGELLSTDSPNKITTVMTGDNFKVPKGLLKPTDKYLYAANGMRQSFEKKKHNYKEHSIDDLTSLHESYLSSITKHKLINGSSSDSKGKISQKYYINQINYLVNLVFKFVITAREFNMLIYEIGSLSRFDDDQRDSENLNGRFLTIYNNLLKMFNEFNSDLKVFINDLSNDDDLNLRYLGISLNQ